MGTPRSQSRIHPIFPCSFFNMAVLPGLGRGASPVFLARLHRAQASGQQCAASTTPVPLFCNLHANTRARRAINYQFDSLEQFLSAQFLRRSTTTGKKAI